MRGSTVHVHTTSSPLISTKSSPSQSTKLPVRPCSAPGKVEVLSVMAAVFQPGNRAAPPRHGLECRGAGRVRQRVHPVDLVGSLDRAGAGPGPDPHRSPAHRRTDAPAPPCGAGAGAATRAGRGAPLAPPHGPPPPALAGADRPRDARAHPPGRR